MNDFNFFRDGTSQAQRLLRALKDEYVRIDERSIADWIRFAQAYAGELKFFNLENQEEGAWENFLQGDADEMAAYIEDPKAFADQPDKVQLYSRPHLVLFLAFLKQMQETKTLLNGLKQKHLNYYYREFLGFTPKAAEPDRVHILVEPARNIRELKIDEGTALFAGKDSLGKDLMYKTEHDVIINQAQLESIKVVHIQKEGDSETLFASEDATQLLASQQLVEDEEAKRWRTFGDPGLEGMETGRLGLAIASPILRLEEGDRIICLDFSSNQALSSDDFHNYFEFSLSTGEGMWLIPGEDETIEPNDEATGFGVCITLNKEAPPIVALPPELRGKGTLDIDVPVLEMVYRPMDGPDNGALDYQELRKLILTKVEITINVNGLTNLSLQNDFSVLDPNNPFEPFGSAPKPGGRFSIFHPEVCGKRLTSITFHRIWQDKPDDLADHYSRYLSLLDPIPVLSDEAAFKADVRLIDKGSDLLDQLDQVYREISLFPTDPNDPPSTQLSSLSEDFYRRYPTIAEGDQVVTSDRYFQLELGEHDFFHGDYPFLLSKQGNIARTVLSFKQGFHYDQSTSDFTLSPTPPPFIEQENIVAQWDDNVNIPIVDYSGGIVSIDPSTKTTQGPGNFTVSLKHLSLDLPLNPPYTPVLQSFTINYEASQEIDLATYTENALDCVFYIRPFGYEDVFSDDVTSLLPPYPTNAGSREDSIAAELYLGIKDLRPPQDLSILFQVAEGSADPEIQPSFRNRVKWYYLCGDFWVEMDEGAIQEDATNNLLQPGLIRFAIPKDATSQHMRMPSGLHWLKAAVDTDPGIVGDMVAIHTQAVRARFEDQNNAGNHLANPLPKEKIKNFVRPIPGIKKVLQPYTSFGGRPAEKESVLNTRISERLRHKHRALNCWDYERLVLEQFPEVYKVKCLTADELFVPDPPELSEEMDQEVIRKLISKEVNQCLQRRGEMHVIVLPDLRGKLPRDPFEPKVGADVLRRIEQFLRLYAPPFAKILVRNPVYEQVRLRVVVRFRKGYNEGFYARQLNKDLQRFLSPWAFDQAADIPIGGHLYASVLINFIEQLDYIDFVVRLYMKNVTENDEFGSTDVSGLSEQRPFMQATRLDSVWVTYPGHLIQVVPDENLIDDNLEGIGYMIVEFDFRVS